MKVNSGLLKGRILISPKSSAVRPTSDKVRAAVFSSLADRAEGARFLDVFAGTGAVGIEAYSRGASFVTFVEKEPSILKTNVKLLPPESYKILPKDIFTLNFSSTYDIIFIDPPYGEYTAEKLLGFIYEKGLLADGGVIVYEESVRTAINKDGMPFELVKERRYGDTVIMYWE